MLIDVGYKVGDVVSMRLTTGEEVVAKMVEENSDVITVEKPMVVARSNEGFGLIPMMITASPDVKLPVRVTALVSVVKTNNEIASGYTQQTTGLAVPG